MITSTGLGLAISTAGVAGLYKILRKKFMYTVNCHFCSKYLKYNGWDSNGDYNKPLISDPSLRFVHDQKKSQSIPQSNGFCRTCNLNQELKIAQLASTKSEGQELENYRQHLERAYKLCPECESVLASKLGQQDAKLASPLLQFRIKQSKLRRSANFNSNENIFKYISFFIVCSLWTILVLFVTEQFNIINIVANHLQIRNMLLYAISDWLCQLQLSVATVGPTILILLVLLRMIQTRAVNPASSSELNNSVECKDRLSALLYADQMCNDDIETPMVAQPVSRLFASTPTPSNSPQLIKSSDEMTINHEFALDNSDSDCDLSILSLGEIASAPSSRSPPFPQHKYSPQPPTLSLFSPPVSLIRPSRLTSTSWVAGGYWTPPSTQNPFTSSRASSQSSGFVSATPSITNHFNSSSQNNTLPLPQCLNNQHVAELDRFSLLSEPIFPNVPTPAASIIGSGRFSIPRKITPDDLSSTSENGSQDWPIMKKASNAKPTNVENTTNATGHHKQTKNDSWTLTITFTPAGVLLAVSVAANIAMAIHWAT